MGKCPNCHGTDVRLIRFHPQHPSSCVEQNQGFCCFKCIEFYMIKEDLPSGDITPLDRKRSTDSYRCGCCCHGYEDKIRISRAIMAELKETLPINIKGINDLQSYSPRVFANSHHDDIEKIMSIDKWDKSQYVNSCQVEEDMNVERGDSDNNNNDVAARGNATNNNPAPGDQDGGSESGAADNDSGGGGGAAAAAGVSAANEDTAANEQHEDGESRAANNINAAAAGGTVAIANENSAANERHDDDGFVANNINAAGGTSVMLSVQVSTSSDRFHHSFNRYLSSEVLAQRDPFTFELGGFVVTFGPRRSRPPPPRDNEGGRNVRRRIGSEHMYAAARGPGDQDGGSGSDAADNNAAAAAAAGVSAANEDSAANEQHEDGESRAANNINAAAAAGVSAANEDSAANEQHEDTEERTSRRGWQLPTSRNRQTSQNRQNRSAADGRPDWVALPVPAGQSQTCPFCEGNIFEDYRNVLPIFDKCIEINGTDATRRGIFRWHSSLTVQDGDRQYHCWPYGVLTTRGLCETIETSLTNRISMNERETTDLIRYLFVGLSFFDVSNFHVFMDDLFASLEQGTIYRNSSDEAMISEYILHWGSVLEAANNHRSNLVRTVRSGRFDRFLGERTRREVGDIIDDVRQSVSLLQDQVDEYDRQEQDDEASASSHLENIVNTWFSSSVISADAISDIMKLSLSKAIFHRLDSIRKTSEMWRNRRH